MKNILNKNWSFYEIFDNDNRFFIPNYQRRYDWEIDNVDEFFESVSSHDKELYYFGNIILIKKDNCFEVVDGQQRITSLYLLLLAMYRKISDKKIDIAKQNDNENLSREELKKIIFYENSYEKLYDILEDIIFLDNYAGKTYSSNDRALRLQEKDDKQLIKLIDSWNEAVNLKRGKIYKNANHFYKHLNDLDNDEDLISVCNKVLSESSKLQFIVTASIVEDDSDAYQLFESINDTGKDLSISDLVKNQIFSKCNKLDCNDLIEELESSWNQIIDKINEIKQEKVSLKFDKFIEFFYLTNYKDKAPKKDVYKKIKKKINELSSKDELVEFVYIMYKDVINILNLVKTNKEAKYIFQKYKLVTPFIMNALRTNTNIDYKAMLYDLYVHYEINSGRGNKIEKHVIKALKENSYDELLTNIERSTLNYTKEELENDINDLLKTTK